MKKSKNLWPVAIAGYFVIFISAMVAWVSFAVRQNMDLVQHDYYEHEMRYQQQIDRVGRTQPLGAKVNINYDQAQREVIINLPAAHVSERTRGRITFYRPSDAKLDQEFKLEVDSSGVQKVGVGTLRPGLWKVRLHWTAEGKEYYFDKAITVAPEKTWGAHIGVATEVFSLSHHEGVREGRPSAKRKAIDLNHHLSMNRSATVPGRSSAGNCRNALSRARLENDTIAAPETGAHRFAGSMVGRSCRSAVKSWRRSSTALPPRFMGSMRDELTAICES